VSLADSARLGQSKDELPAGAAHPAVRRTRTVYQCRIPASRA